MNFREIDYQPTPMGPLILRERRLLSLERTIQEVILGEEHLMSSLFTAGEEALGRLSLEAASAPAPDVLVGGLGLGYTAAAFLDAPQVNSLVVVEALPQVADWHKQGLVELGPRLCADPRCRFEVGDFFAMVRSGAPPAPGRFDVVAVDIDHSTEAWLAASHGDFYGEAGLSALRDWLRPEGVFGLWSDAAPDPAFLERLGTVFSRADAEVVEFDNPLRDTAASCTIYRAWR